MNPFIWIPVIIAIGFGGAALYTIIECMIQDWIARRKALEKARRVQR